MLIDTDPESTRAVLAAQVDDFARLSRWYADRDDTRRAVLATWAADVRAVQLVLWEGGLHSAPDIDHAFGTVGEAVVAAMADGDLDSVASLRDLVEKARQSMVSAFDGAVHELVRDAFIDLDHLDALPGATAGASNRSVADRLDGRSGEQLVADLLATSMDSRLVAQVMAEVGDDDEARRQEVAATLAAFEAYLVLSSAAAGDVSLVTTDLRWDLAALVADLADLGDPDRLRAVLRTVVAPAELSALLAVLDLPLPERTGA